MTFRVKIWLTLLIILTVLTYKTNTLKLNAGTEACPLTSLGLYSFLLLFIYLFEAAVNIIKEQIVTVYMRI